MSPAYVLIILLSAYYSNGGNALTTTSFSTREACEVVGKAAKDMGNVARPITYRCVSTRPE